MNLQHLRYAAEVERCGSINKAAKNLYITQPYLSTCLKDLEEELNVTLFKRSVQGITITSEGREFLTQARSLLAHAENLEKKYKQKTLHEHTFKIASVRSVVPMLGYINFLNGTLNMVDYSKLGFFETGLVQTIDAVYHNEASLGVLMFFSGQIDFINSYGSIKDLELTEVDSVPAYIIVSKDHDLANGLRLEQADMSQYLYATYGDYSDSILNVANECKLIGIEPASRVIFVHDRYTLLYVLKTTNAYAVAHRFRPEDEKCYNLTSIPVANEKARVCFGYIKSKHHTIEEESLEMAFLEELRRAIKLFQ
jgi:DNA-binding transcriptional LysR family regulator